MCVWVLVCHTTGSSFTCKHLNKETNCHKTSALKNRSFILSRTFFKTARCSFGKRRFIHSQTDHEAACALGRGYCDWHVHVAPPPQSKYRHLSSLVAEKQDGEGKNLKALKDVHDYLVWHKKHFKTNVSVVLLRMSLVQDDVTSFTDGERFVWKCCTLLIVWDSFPF